MAAIHSGRSCNASEVSGARAGRILGTEGSSPGAPGIRAERRRCRIGVVHRVDRGSAISPEAVGIRLRSSARWLSGMDRTAAARSKRHVYLNRETRDGNGPLLFASWRTDCGIQSLSSNLPKVASFRTAARLFAGVLFVVSLSLSRPICVEIPAQKSCRCS